MDTKFDARLTNCQSYADLYAKRYRLKQFVATKRSPQNKGPVGVAFLSHPNGYFQSVVFERGNDWLYAAPVEIVRQDEATT